MILDLIIHKFCMLCYFHVKVCQFWQGFSSIEHHGMSNSEQYDRHVCKGNIMYIELSSRKILT